MLTPDETRAIVGGLFIGEGYFGISIRKRRPHSKHGISMLPAASMGMNDVESVEQISDWLKEHNMAHWVFRHKTKTYAQINIHGLKRLSRFLPWVIPVVTGAKLRCAQNLFDYVEYRLALPQRSPVTVDDLNYVRIARSLNGRQGLARTADIEEIERILRDYTSDTLSGDEIVRAA